MVKVSASFSFTIFPCLLFLFTFSSARTTLDHLPLIDDNNHDLFSASDNNPNAANTILLPSENHESEPATLVHLEPPTTHSSQASDSDPDPIPFTLITLRPINRPFPLSFLYRRRHRCRHNNRFKPLNPRLRYADDMNIEGGNFDPLPRPGRWMRFGHVEQPSMEKSEETSRPHHRPEPEHEDEGLTKRIRKFLNHF